jgi:hypothetical protein
VRTGPSGISARAARLEYFFGSISVIAGVVVTGRSVHW